MKSHQHVEIPGKLFSRPRDERGYPIPWNVRLDADGKPDFRVIDAEKTSQAIRLKRCALCGGALGRHLAFIGGPISFETRMVADSATHKECGLYAIQVCPWLAAPSMRYAEKIPEMSGSHTFLPAYAQEVAPERPDRFFIGVTSGYQLVRSPQGAWVLQADPWQWHEWWRHGARVDTD